MGVEFIRESSRDAQYTQGENGKSTAARSWIAKADSPATSPDEVADSAPVQIGDPFPGDSSLKCTRVRARANGSDGMLWTVTAEYEVRPDPEDDDNPPDSDRVPGKPDVWSASSTVQSEPVYLDTFGDVISNSAGDPLEDLTADVAQFRLTLTTYRLRHQDWQTKAKEFTNSLNADNWNGGAPGTWKCQGCSAKLNIEERDGLPLIFWELNWEFAYKESGWQLKPWNIGFHQLVDQNGDPDPYGGERAVIVGQDKKGVRHPVALNADGTAKPAGEKPDALFVIVYFAKEFGPEFGELYTPGQ